jgi:hypothetical protein
MNYLFEGEGRCSLLNLSGLEILLSRQTMKKINEKSSENQSVFSSFVIFFHFRLGN